MKKRDFYKADNGKDARTTFSMPWLRKTDISEEERDAIFAFDENGK